MSDGPRPEADLSTQALSPVRTGDDARSMTTTASPAAPPTVPAERRALRSSRVLLWLPVLCAAAAAWFLTRAFDAISVGAPDLDPLYGFFLLLFWAGALLIGGTASILALVHSFGMASGRSFAATVSALVTAVCGSWLVWMSVSSNRGDPALTASSTAGDQVVWEVAAGVAVLLPLVAVLAASVVDRVRGSRG